MTPIRVTLALMLVMVAVLLAAGCIASLGFENKPRIIPQEKYIFVEHHINSNGVTLSGECAPPVWIDFPFYSFNKKNEVLTVGVLPSNPINESLILFYGSGRSLSGVAGQGASTGASPVYSLPEKFPDNVTLDTISGDGTVTLHYNNKQLSLKPNESWVNITRFNENRKFPDHTTNCTAEITITDSLYNAGLLDKRTIVPRLIGGSWLDSAFTIIQGSIHY